MMECCALIIIALGEFLYVGKGQPQSLTQSLQNHLRPESKQNQSRDQRASCIQISQTIIQSKALILTIIFLFQQPAQDQLLTLNLHTTIQLTILIGISTLQNCLVYGIPCQSLTLIKHSSPSKLNLATCNHFLSFNSADLCTFQMQLTKFQGLQTLTFYKYRLNDCTLVS